MKKPNINSRVIALCAVALTSTVLTSAYAGPFGNRTVVIDDRGAKPEAGDDRGRGGKGKDDPIGHNATKPTAADDRGGVRGGNGADDKPGDDRGRGGHNDPKAH